MVTESHLQSSIELMLLVDEASRGSNSNPSPNSGNLEL